MKRTGSTTGKSYEAEPKRVRFGTKEHIVVRDAPAFDEDDEQNVDVLGRKITASSSYHVETVVEEPEFDSRKHTLDSDEEDDEKKGPKQLDIRKVRGQEKATIEYDDGIKIMAFNMKEEMEEGHYDEEGNFVFEKKNENIRDHWLDNVDWDMAKHNAGSKWHKMNDYDEEAEPPKVDAINACDRILDYLTNDTMSASDVLKKLHSQKKLSAAEERKQRWAAKRRGEEYKNDQSEAANKLTGAVDELITLGHMQAYNLNREGILKIQEVYEIEKERAERDERMKKLIKQQKSTKTASEAETSDAKTLIEDLYDDADSEEEMTNIDDKEMEVQNNEVVTTDNST